MAHYAHSRPDRPVEEWQPLEQHLNQTACLANRFTSDFAPGWGNLAGLWHDAGKYRREFQARIGAGDGRTHLGKVVDHKTVGAIIADARKVTWLGFAIAGHHGGMPNRADLESTVTSKRQLLEETIRDGMPPNIRDAEVPAIPEWLKQATPAALSLWIRFIFSALVDADFLDTERFYGKDADRNVVRPPISVLRAILDQHLDQFGSAAEPTPMNRMRAAVLSACRDAALLDPGLFTLTVPTGGGKTLSSLSFALRHAQKHGKSRVIVVIPYTSIIEQTAAAYRNALSACAMDAVLEHHTNVDPEKETSANRLASENWDAPIVVTTSVQFFESVFAHKPSRCRKLHQIANSVVVLDEVQTLPAKLLAPIRHVLSELVAHYHVTVVLCTATQPVLIEGAREMVTDYFRHFQLVADRCEILMPGDAPITWEALASELQSHDRVMTIVHRRDDAQELAKLLGPDCLHLSARMCALHRTEILRKVKGRLLAGQPCRLVATQLVEAGVDIDFPEVYRAFAGADSLAQAAGRCNREGRGTGRLHIFRAPSRPPRGILMTAQAVAQTMLGEGRLDLKLQATFSEFFRRLYDRADLDSPAIMPAEREQRFEDVARTFRMIDQTGQPVVAPYGDWADHVEAIRDHGISRVLMRRLQPFMVTLYPHEIETLSRAGALEHVAESFWVVVPGYKVYDDRWGFGWQGNPAAEPEDLIA